MAKISSAGIQVISNFFRPQCKSAKLTKPQSSETACKGLLNYDSDNIVELNNIIIV